jgi:DNA-binding transcriptional MerR regulator
MKQLAVSKSYRTLMAGMSKFKTRRTFGGIEQPARTIRFYIARGLLDGPLKAGRGAVYTAEHFARLEKIKEMQAEGRMLAEIAHDLNGGPPLQTAVPPSPWWQYAIHDDVMIWVRGDVSPWRMKQIRAAVDDMTSRLREPESGADTRRNRQ